VPVTGDGTSTPGSFTGVAAAAKAAIESGQSSPTTFAAEQMGGTLAELEASNKKTIWDAFKLDSQKTSIENMKEEYQALPKDMTDYITARDSYIKQTDKAIKDYMEEISHKDMSDPTTARQANSYLTYLYTLRGRQNQSYMGYLNDAVTQHETKLNNDIDDYNSQLAIATEQLTNINAISKEEYTTKFNSYSELYQSIMDAPTRALQLQILKDQVAAAAGTSVADQVDLDAKIGYIAQREDLKKADFIDSNGFAKPGTILVDEINNLAVTNPSTLPGNIILTYAQGVQDYMNASNEKDEVTGTGVTASGKKRLAEEAIRNFAQLAAVGMQSGNDAAVNQGIQSAITIGDSLASRISGDILDIAPQVMEAVKSLAPGGTWYTLGIAHPQPPTLAEFIATMKKKTTDDPMAESIAQAIYAVWQRYTSEPNSTTKGAVDSLLNNVTSTSGRIPYTHEEFAQLIGRIYAENVIVSEFGINSDISNQMLATLYPSS
jgi:hypothetical protein